jgi:hypothetical protein
MFFGFRIASPLELRVKSAKIRENVNLKITKSKYGCNNFGTLDLYDSSEIRNSHNTRYLSHKYGLEFPQILTKVIHPIPYRQVEFME